jgi:pimeloyl-ACP methyl ester carboxylesterase
MSTEAIPNPLRSAGAGAPANGDPVGNTTNLCEAPPKKKIPIIFVPGVMGSRLNFTNIDQQWDPDAKWKMWHWIRIGAERARTELRVSEPARVMTDIDDPIESAHGYGGMVGSFYVSFLRYLRGEQFNLNVATPVYAIGYDWRQSNKLSGEYVTGEVNRIMGLEGASQVILVSHSMGGIVTRSAMKDGLAGKVLGVVHIFQPVDGAVVLYRRFFTGTTKEFDSDGTTAGDMLCTILGDTPDKAATISSGMPGPLQLLPTNNYRDTEGAWLKFKQGGVTTPLSGDVYDLYTGAACPPALLAFSGLPRGFSAAAASDLKSNTLLAKSFHAGLDRYQHPKTKTIHSTGRRVDMAIVFDPPTAPAASSTTIWTEYGPQTVNTTPAWTSRGAQRIARPEGDGTVPGTSANVLKPNVVVHGIEHSAACGDAAGAVRAAVKKWIIEFLS